jgi:2-methylisocitrate lyase-like PEP mutase family enzyme
LLEGAGAGGIMMEDQRSPLSTSTAGGVAVISNEAAIGKFKAAADAVFLTGALSVADMARVGREVKPPHNMAMPFGYISKSLTPAQVREMGFDFTSIASFVPAEAYAMLKYLEAGLADGAKAERELHAMVKDSPVAD